MHNAEHDGNAKSAWSNGATRSNGSAEAAESYVDQSGGRDQVERVLDALWRGWWIILLVFLTVFLGVAAYTYTIDPLYQSDSLVLVSKPRPSTSAQFSGTQGAFGRSERSISNELVVLRNNLEIAREVAKRLRQMETIPGTNNPITVLYAPGSAEPLPVETVALRVQSRMNFGQERQDVDVIRMTATSNVPKEAALMANQYMREYINLTRRMSRRQAQASVEFLQQQVTQGQDSLERAEARIESFLDRARTVSLDQEAAKLFSQITQAQAARDEAQLELQSRRALLTSLEQRLDSVDANLPQRLASGVEGEIQLVQERLNELQTRKNLALANNPDLTPDSPRLLKTNLEIEELRDQKRNLVEQYIEEVRAVSGMSFGGAEGAGGISGVAELQRQALEARIAVQGLESRIDVINEREREYEAELDAIPEQSRELSRLQRDRANAEKTYQAFLERLQGARVEEASEPGYAEPVREALVPNTPVRPNTQRNLMAGFFGGLFLGLGLALARSALDKRIYKPEELREQGRNVIGIVPDIAALDVRKRRGAQEETYVEQEGRRFDASLVSLVSPMSAAAEAYRHLRTNIQFSSPDKSVRTILVTSATMGEGKSVTAANLAVVMAQAGRRTLLIDADLRRPRVHRLMGAQREPGLVQRLFSENGAVDKGAVTEEMETGIDNLYVLTAGKAVPNPAELIGSESMSNLMGRLQEEFDTVIVDSPPVLAATDAALLSTRCDATIVVARAAQVKTYELDHCLKSLKSVGATVVGVLLNGFDASKGYGYRYGYHYYYDAYSEDRSRRSRRTFTDRIKETFQRS